MLTDTIIVQSIWLQGDQGEDCPITFTVRQEGQNAQSLADQFHIPIEIFQGNNYCYNKDGSGTICPPFLPGKVSFWILNRSSIRVLSFLLTDCVHCTLPHYETLEVSEV